MMLALALALLGQQAQTEWRLPIRGLSGRTHDLVQRIDDPAKGVSCYVVREAADNGVGISCVRVPTMDGPRVCNPP